MAAAGATPHLADSPLCSAPSRTRHVPRRSAPRIPDCRARHSGGHGCAPGLRDIESRADCERLVRAFYGRALEDPIIGFIFVDVAKLDLEAHVPRITSFWETILLGAQSYGGGAFRPHAELHAKVRCARALRAVAEPLVRHGRRAVRRRPRRAGQDACASGGPGVPRTPRGDGVSRRCGARAERPDGDAARLTAPTARRAPSAAYDTAMRWRLRAIASSICP